MRAAVSKTEIESEITSRFGSAFKLHEKRPAEVISTGLGEVDSFIGGGLPRGSITEVFGPASSGRTSFMLSALAHATERQEVCALVDTNNAFDPKSASQAEINFARLLWIRCANHLEHAFKSTDLLLQGGGFGLIVLDLGDVAAKDARRVISSWWYRFRRTVENTPTALVVIAAGSCVRSCAAMTLELRRELDVWSSAITVMGQADRHQSDMPVILKASKFSVVRQRPIGLRPAEFWVYAHTNLKEQILQQEKSLRLAKNFE